MQVFVESYLTAGTGVLALLLGRWLNNKVSFLHRICFPAPVTGGIIFSLVTLALHAIFGLEIIFDGTLKDICMMIFFTSVGFQSNVTVFKAGGRPLVVMLILVTVLMVFQNLIGVGLAHAMHVSPLVGMAAGSVTMCGGHGTAGGFGPILENMGLQSASSVAMAAATFGLVAGSVLGGPLADSLIRRHSLKPTEEESEIQVFPRSERQEMDAKGLTMASFELVLAMACGTLVSKLLSLTGIAFPTYFGSLLAAAVIRNLGELPGAPKLHTESATVIGNVCLSLFLGMAMISLRLWELANLALPLFLILCLQVLFMWFYARFAAFPVLGRDYDAAVLVSGLCGFGLGATPNAMANMSAVCGKYSYTVKPFVIVPLIGALFVDIINTTVISLFLNWVA